MSTSLVGQFIEVTVTPAVTASNAYGTNYCVGGLLTFTNIFSIPKSGCIVGVAVNIKKVETSGFTFVPFYDAPAGTYTDAVAANIASGDIPLVREPVILSPYSGLGTHTIYYADGLLIPFGVNTSVNLSALLIANAALTNQFSTTSDVSVTVKIVQDR